MGTLKEYWIEELTEAYMSYDGIELDDKDCEELANMLRCQDEKRN
jgi:hypothetical protein